MKRLLVLLTVLAMFFCLGGCALGNLFGEIQHRELRNGPLAQPGTMWQSEDGKITFSIIEVTTENGAAVRGEGTMQIGNETVDIFFSTGPSTTVWIESYSGNTLEKGTGDF